MSVRLPNSSSISKRRKRWASRFRCRCCCLDVPTRSSSRPRPKGRPSKLATEKPGSISEVGQEASHAHFHPCLGANRFEHERSSELLTVTTRWTKRGGTVWENRMYFANSGCPTV